MRSILITGGAGYIGSHNVRFLIEKGFEVTVLDDLSGGFRDALPAGMLIEGDIGDRDLLDRLFNERSVDAVLNFASFIEVGASVRSPSAYYLNNTARTLTLLDAMVRHGIQQFVFSSTAAIFGNPQYTPIDEAHPCLPINPYGRSKYLIEQVLQDYHSAYGLRSVCLRYFNAAGAHPDGSLGERHEPETHLIPLILQAASGRRESISVFGSDYDTADGTCVRDYIHVQDLAQAHWRALEFLSTESGAFAFNLGNGQGYSIKQVIAAVEKVTGRSLLVRQAQRREGDPAVLVADSRLAREVLAWQPEYALLEDIVAHAWQWELQKGQRW